MKNMSHTWSKGDSTIAFSVRDLDMTRHDPDISTYPAPLAKINVFACPGGDNFQMKERNHNRIRERTVLTELTAILFLLQVSQVPALHRLICVDVYVFEYV